LFTCQATGIPIPNISWYFNGAPVEDTITVKYMVSEMSFNPTTKNSTLRVINVESSDSGTYTCKAVNSISSDTSSGVLSIDGKFFSQILLYFCYHPPVALTCSSFLRNTVSKAHYTVFCTFHILYIMVANWLVIWSEG